MEINATDYNMISNQAKDWAINNLGSDFKFRDYQLDIIVSIVFNTLKNIKTHVCEAPTGTGKSLIGFIAAGVLAEYYNKSSYILCSDTALFKQYEEDIKRYNLNFGCVCGKDNYFCSKNGLSFSSSKCQQNSTSIKKLIKGEDVPTQFQNCSKACKYINALKKGHKSKVTILTYQLYFSTNIDTEDNFEYSDFHWKKRDLVICDEAHKLPEIVQNLFSPKIDINNNIGIDAMIRFGDLTNANVPNRKQFEDVFKVMKTIMKNSYASESQRSNDMIICLKQFRKLMKPLHDESYIKIESKVGKGEFSKKVDLSTFLKASTSFIQMYTTIKEYLSLINDIGTEWAVPSLLDEHTIVFNCAKEPEMVKAFFHKKTNCEFLMSATIGNLDTFRTMISSDDDKDFIASEADNNFDFSRSPIYYNDNSYRLSYREKERNKPKVLEQIEEICNNYTGVHGIIQTGSYEFSSYIRDNASSMLRSRLVFYNNASERKQAIENFENFYGKILIGPSLLEGLDFADDLCRFIIVMKVPYASLADRLVKSKMAIYPDWYANDTINKMIQGLGRGVRSKNDWCESYILDGCWNDVMTRSKHLLTEKILSRMKPMSESGIQC